MGHWLVIGLALLAVPAAAQTLEQYETRQQLDRSNAAVQAQTAGRGAGTSNTINQRMERLNTQQQIQSQRQLSLPDLGARAPLR